ncbi:cdk5 [Symbiodinium sp. CCMP2592]|nr:cdk5 [Symbiodinium sp. CCMP2592]
MLRHRATELLSFCLRTRWYRAPELFLGSRGDSSVDLWSAGCTIAELILRRPWVPGSDTRDMLFRICGELGAPDESEGWPLAAQLVEASGRKNAEPAAWQSLREAGASQAAVDMLESLLRYDGQRRLRCDKALRELPFFTTEEPEVPVPVPVSRPLSPATLQRSREEVYADLKYVCLEKLRLDAMCLFQCSKGVLVAQELLRLDPWLRNLGFTSASPLGRFSYLTTQSNVLLLIWSLLHLVEPAFRDDSGNLTLTCICYSGEPFFGGLGIFVSAAYAVTMHDDKVSVHFIRKAVRDGRLRLHLSSRIPTEEEWRQDQVIAHAPQIMISLVTAATRDAALLERHLPRSPWPVLLQGLLFGMWYSACLLSVWQASKLWPYPFMYSFRHWSHHVGLYVAAFGTSSLLAVLHWRLLWWRTQ